MKTTLKVLSFLAIVLIISIIQCNVDQTSKKQWFLECSENEGDMGCDSCYFLVYGKHVDTYDLFYGK